MNIEEHERRLQRFESIISTFIDKNPLVNTELIKHDSRLERTNST